MYVETVCAVSISFFTTSIEINSVARASSAKMFAIVQQAF
jgi:hypothetical protein